MQCQWVELETNNLYSIDVYFSLGSLYVFVPVVVINGFLRTLIPEI